MRIFQRLFKRPPEVSFVPSMDGPLQPNRGLDDSAIYREGLSISDMCWHKGRLLGARGTDLIELEGMKSERAFDAPIAALAATDERLAVAITGQGIWQDTGEGWQLSELPDAGSVTAICWHGADLYFTRGARDLPASEWRRDLLELGHSGSLGMIRTGVVEILVDGLAWPAGLLVQSDGKIIFSEAWAHRLCSFDGQIRTVFQDLPAYPGRLCKSTEDGFLLACFAPRRPLFEFILSEDAFRRDMLRTTAPDNWIAPSLTPNTSTQNSIVQGEIRQMGVMKPWAPSASYGLVVRFGSDMRPRESWHSRADKHRHGIISLVANGADALALSAAAGMVITLPDGAIK